jgi:hypothetical protein
MCEAADGAEEVVEVFGVVAVLMVFAFLSSSLSHPAEGRSTPSP